MPGDDPNEQDDWLRYSGLSEREKMFLRRRRRQNAPPLFASVVLIAAGILLFLSSLGWLPIRNVWALWPLVLVAMGTGKLFHARNSAERVFGVFIVCAGALLLLLTLHIVAVRLRDPSWPIALLLILLGCALLVKTLERGTRARPLPGAPRDGSSESQLNGAAILGSIKRKVETENFEGGAITNFMGSVEIDLRRAQIRSATRSATIEVKAIAGAVNIRIPDTWRVNMSALSVLGALEDKTIPPNTGQDAPVLEITGYSAFSAIELEN